MNTSDPENRTVRHGGNAPVRDSVYSESDLLKINREHDLKNGWSPESSQVFTNRHRLPETTEGNPAAAWEKRS